MAAPPGRVPRQSAVVAGVVAVAAMAGLAASVDLLVPVIVGLLAGSGLGVGVATVSIDRPLRALLGGGLLLCASAVAVGAPVRVALTDGTVAGGLVAAAVVVGFGLASLRLAAFGDGAIASALAWLARVALVVGAGTLLAGIAGVDVPRVLDLVAGLLPVAELVRPTTGGAAMLGFVAVCWLAYGGFWLATVAVPVSTLRSGRGGERVDEGLSRGRAIAGAVLGAGSVLLALLYAVAVVGATVPGVGPLVALVVESAGVRVVLVRVFLAGVGVATAIVSIRSVGGVAVGARPGWVPSALVVTAGVSLAVTLWGEQLVAPFVGAVPAAGGVLDPVATFAGPATAGFLLATGGLVAVGAALAVGPLLAALGLLPARTAGPRLVLLGLAGAGTLVALADGPSVLFLAGVVAGIVAWDVGGHGALRAADVGPTPARDEGTVLHAAGSLLFGVAALVVVAGVHGLLVGAATALPGTLLATGLAAGAVVVLVVLLRW